MKRQCVVLILLLGLAVRLCLAFSDRDRLIELFFFDDSFYLLNIARNIAAGNGFTHDGMHATNGFQPLYVFLLVPVYWMADLNRIYPIYFATILLSICGVVSAFLCYRITEQLFNKTAASFSLVFTLFSPFTLNYSLNGAETSLMIVLLLATLHMYFKDFQWAILSDHSTIRVVVFGALLGFAVLSRIDMLLLLMVIYAELSYSYLRKPNHRKKDLKQLLILSLVVAAIILPWFIYNFAYFHSIIPTSGAAVRQLALMDKDLLNNHLLGTFSEGKLLDLFPVLKETLGSNGNLLFYYNLFVESCHIVKRFAVIPNGLMFYWRLLRALFGQASDAGWQIQLLAWIFGLATAVIMALLVSLWWRKETGTDAGNQFRHGLRRIRPLLIFSVFLAAAYIWRVCAWWHFQRYLAPICYVISILLSLLLFVVFDSIPFRNQKLRSLAIALVVGSLLFFFYCSFSTDIKEWGRFKQSHSTGMETIYYIQNSFPETDKLGALQSGYLSYFLEQKVYNLDGVVNPEAIVATSSNRLGEYIISEQIKYIVDSPIILGRLLQRYPRLRSRAIPVLASPQFTFHIYRIDSEPR
jgi:hypothetical protein